MEGPISDVSISMVTFNEMPINNSRPLGSLGLLSAMLSGWLKTYGLDKLNECLCGWGLFFTV